MSRMRNRHTEPIAEMSERPLLWWRVPERPGVGAAMVRNAVVWLVSIMALLVIVAVLR